MKKKKRGRGIGISMSDELDDGGCGCTALVYPIFLSRA